MPTSTGEVYPPLMDEPRKVTRIYADLADEIGPPNCPECLHPMEPKEFDIGLEWWCARCGQTDNSG